MSNTYEPKKSCFACKEVEDKATHTKHLDCIILNDFYCTKEAKDCKFYRTKNEYRELMKKYPIINISSKK